MHPLINNLVQEESLLAQALQAQQGLTSFSIPNIATFNLLAHGSMVTVVNLYVVPSMRRQGIGTALFRKIEQLARETGFSLLGLSVFTGRPDSASAEMFAQGLGLRVFDAGCVGELKNYVKPIRPMIGVVQNSSESSQEPTGVGA